MHVQARTWSKWFENWNDSSISGWNRGRYSTSNDVLMQWTQSLVNFLYTVTFEPHCRNSVKHSPFALLLSVISLSLCPGSHCPLLVMSPNVSLLITPFACLLRGLFIRRLPNLLIFIFFIRISFLFTVIIFFFFWCFCNNELMFVSSLT